MKLKKRSPMTSINWDHFAFHASEWEDSVIDKIDGEYNREAIKEDLKERRAAVMNEAAEAGKRIRKARRSFANYKTRMTSLRHPDGTVTASRRAMEKVIYNFYSDLFDSHVYLPTHHLRQDEYIAPSVLPSEIQHAITSMKNCTAPGPDRIKPEHLKSLPAVIVRILARLFTPYLSDCCCTESEIQTISAVTAQSACCL
uniref:MRG domain-containing protein n=1 Tax=Haemonchus contortus TaxID=6289 RepID=A0A7I5EE89_HAECO